MVFTGIIVSFYYFPFEFSFLPGLNTKMGLAVYGIITSLISLMSIREIRFPYNLVRIEISAVIVSLVGLVAVVINNTPDLAYATYVVSMTVWLSGAYSVCYLIKTIHGKISVELLTVYLVSVCVAQCIIALIIDSNIVIKNIVDAYVMQDQLFLTDVERLYGIGASLDTAGVRFSICLLMLTFTIDKNKNSMSLGLLIVSVLAFLVIAIVGNMVARTTIVGVGLSLIYAIMTFKPIRVSMGFFRLLKVSLIALIIIIPICVYLYDNSPQFYRLSRFAFEGFFNLIETGEWEIDSNEKLKSMMVFPDNFKTWIIGDGYFSNPFNTDPTYVGPYIGGYYMGTDIGFLRFIFYFGFVGLLAFSAFLVSVSKECINMLPDYKVLIFLILLLGFVVWLKVATDVFLVFALLICIGNMQDAPQQFETES